VELRGPFPRLAYVTLVGRLARLVGLTLALVGLGAFAAGAAVAPPHPDMTFYPQAGVLWQDLYPNNFVDLDPGPGVRDFACGMQTYDGHTGTDSGILGFRQMDIGVPVFAALDGRVISIQDGMYDRNYGPRPTARFDNHVVLEHGPGRFTIYGHLRKGIELRRGQQVRAGQQLGWTASSGNSTGPHLHFTSHVGSEVSEPFAGPCREGASGWTGQSAWPAKPYLRDVTLSSVPLGGLRDLPEDRGPRTGTFVRGARTIYSRVVLGAVWQPTRLVVAAIAPGGREVARIDYGEVSTPHGAWHWWSPWRLSLVPGYWRLQVELGGERVLDAPFRVVATQRQVRNRRPNVVSASLQPAAPRAQDVVQCLVATSLGAEDPDYDVVAYRYRWTVGGRVVRTVRSAALSDVARRGAAAPGQRLACSVTPTDGRLSAATASAAATVSP
jgi:murein DD-endopeptidase